MAPGERASFAARKPLTLSQACCNRVRCFCWCWCWCSFVTHVWTDSKFHVVSQDEKRGKNPAKAWTTRRLRAKEVFAKTTSPPPRRTKPTVPTYLYTSTTAMPPSAMDTPVFRRLRSRSSSARDERGTPSGRRTLRSGRRSLIPLPYSYIHSFTAQIAPCSPPHPEAACFSESASYILPHMFFGEGKRTPTQHLLPATNHHPLSIHHPPPPASSGEPLLRARPTKLSSAL